jgi:hypothetical protein
MPLFKESLFEFRYSAQFETVTQLTIVFELTIQNKPRSLSVLMLLNVF